MERLLFRVKVQPRGVFSSTRRRYETAVNLTFPQRGGRFPPMRSLGGVFVVVCSGVCFAGAHLSRAQEATSANLPDQFQTGEMIQTQKAKKKKAEATSQILATVPTQDTAPVPEHTLPAAEEVPTRIAPAEEKKAEPNQSAASMPPTQKPATPTEQAPSAEEPEVVAVPVEKKSRPRKRPRPAVQPEAASISAPVPMSFSVAQSIAITAPLPEYTYEMKRRNLSGSGICVVVVDTATGTVTNATMFQSTGSPLLDKLTIQTFKSWKFKPGTVSQVRVPISYE
jgi:TonB family protein